MKTTLLLILLAFCSTTFGQIYHVEVSPWTGTNQPVPARLGLLIGTNDAPGGNATDGMVLTRTGASSQWQLGGAGGSITNVFIFTNIVVLNTNTTITNIFYFTNIVSGFGDANVWTTNGWPKSYLDPSGDLWTANVTTDGAHLQTWYMGNISLGGASENVPRVFDGGGQSDGNILGGQYVQAFDSGYNIGSVSFSGPAYSMGLTNCVGNLMAMLNTMDTVSSWNATIGANNYNTNVTYSFSGGYFNSAVCSTAFGLAGWDNTLGTSGLGWYAGQGNLWFMVSDAVGVGQANTTLYSSSGTYMGDTNYVAGDQGSSIHCLKSFCVSNAFCDISGIGQGLTNNTASRFSGAYNISTNGYGLDVSGESNIIWGFTSHSVISGSHNVCVLTNTGCTLNGLSNTLGGMNVEVTLQGTMSFASNCNNAICDGYNVGFTNCSGGFFYGLNGHVTRYSITGPTVVY
jgi:hypothetical protein